MSEDDDLAADARKRVGQLLCGKYRIERVIGIGGMASVYAAAHRNGRRVALKMLHPDLSVRADLRKRFLREAQAANAVNHAGAVVVLDDDVAEDGAAFLVMELLDGQSVEELWEAHEQRLSLKLVLSIAHDLCDVLAAAHLAGIVHRDIKPANLFVTSAGQLKVLDFGIASVRDEAGPRATQTGTVLGTPVFMAPEQASGRVSQLDARTDIWAVGATMFTLLSGRPVHDGESAQHITILAATQPARSLATVALHVEPEVVAVVDRALAFESADRWPSAAAMQAAISEASVALFGRSTPVSTGFSDTMMAAESPFETVPLRTGTLESPKAPGGARRLLGSTTGQPVSSTSITAVRGVARRSTWIQLASEIVGRLARVFEHLRRPATVRADDPVSSSAPTKRRIVPSRPMVLFGIGASVIVALSALAVVRETGETTVGPPAGVGVSGVPSVSAAPPPPAVLTSTAPPTTAPPSSAVQSPASVASAASIQGPKAPAPRPRAPTAPAAASTKVSCSPPFTIQDGIQVHKPGCP